MLHALLMAGGGGTRFWPRSRQRCPKQFLKLAGDRSLLQSALDRIEALVPPERTWVVTCADQRDLVAEQLPTIPGDRIVAEPMGRDTAACIGVGAALIAATDPDATFVATPADHVIEPHQEFRRAIQAGVQLADEHPLASITFGIAPTYPSTGYGYVQRGQPMPPRLGVPTFAVRAFREKPDADTAERYVQSGEYLWNSGIFIWKARTLLGELERLQPSLHEAVCRIAAAWGKPGAGETFRSAYEPLKRLSIDYAVMERCRQGIVLLAPFQWDDVGSWLALERMAAQDEDGNTIQGLHCGIETRHCLIVGDGTRLLATAGVQDLIIVQDGDATLIANKRDEAATKKLVEQLKARGLHKYL